MVPLKNKTGPAKTGARLTEKQKSYGSWKAEMKKLKIKSTQEKPRMDPKNGKYVKEIFIFLLFSVFIARFG